MSIVLPEILDRRLIVALGVNMHAESRKWGWVGSVDKTNMKDCESFILAVTRGDVEEARKHHSFGVDMFYSIAGVSDNESEMYLINKDSGSLSLELVGKYPVKGSDISVLAITPAKEITKEMSQLGIKECVFECVKSILKW